MTLARPGNERALARRARRRVLEYAATQPVHLGASLSVLDILVAAYTSAGFSPERLDDPSRDLIVLSKGHAVWALYAVLAEFGVPGLDDVRAGHPVDGIPGLDAATGALGHGLAIGAGMAVAARMDGSARRVTVIMGDGELDEGSVWEAAMFCAHQRLGNLVAVVDRNGLQQEGATEDTLALEPLADKWAAFGWDVHSVDGHNPGAVRTLIDSQAASSGPRVLLAATVKGKGVPFMEHDPNWHFADLDEQHLHKALAFIDESAS
jgi:transketolase